jgi:hypothetical protein
MSATLCTAKEKRGATDGEQKKQRTRFAIFAKSRPGGSRAFMWSVRPLSFGHFVDTAGAGIKSERVEAMHLTPPRVICRCGFPRPPRMGPTAPSGQWGSGGISWVLRFLFTVAELPKVGSYSSRTVPAPLAARLSSARTAASAS